MFTKLKQFKDLRDKAKDMQSALARESADGAAGGVRMTLDGNLAMKIISIDSDLLSPGKKERLEASVKDAYGDALKKIQRAMAVKVKQMGGLPDIPGLN